MMKHKGFLAWVLICSFVVAYNTNNAHAAGVLPGMDSLTLFFEVHSTFMAALLTGALDLAIRLWPTKTPTGIFQMVSGIFKRVARLAIILSATSDKVLPQTLTTDPK